MAKALVAAIRNDVIYEEVRAKEKNRARRTSARYESMK